MYHLWNLILRTSKYKIYFLLLMDKDHGYRYVAIEIDNGHVLRTFIAKYGVMFHCSESFFFTS